MSAALTVSPAAGLVDRQVVTVDLSGFEGQFRKVFECRTGAADLSQCDNSYVGGAIDPDATEVALVVDPVFGNGDDPKIDCRRAPGTCSAVGVMDSVISDGYPLTGAPSVPLDFKRRAPFAPAPRVALAPNRGLRDGETVAVTGSGFVPQSDSSVHLCVAGARRASDCGRAWDSQAPIDENGDVRTSVVIDPTFSTSTGRIIDCRMQRRRCLLVVGNVSDPGDASRTSVRFDRRAPLLPRPTISIEPARNLVDDRLVTVTGAGFPVEFYGTVGVGECPAHHIELATCRTLPSRGTRSVSDDGRFQVSVAPDATISDGKRDIDCRAAVGRCVLVAALPTAEYDEIGTVRLAFDPNAPLRPPPVLQAEPATGLRYGQAVMAVGTGFRPSTQLNVVVCAAPGGPTGHCTGGGFMFTDTSGTARRSVLIPTSFDPYDHSGPVSCLAPGSCVIQATEYITGEQATTPVSFGPQPPPARYLDPVFDRVDITQDLVYGHAINSTGIDQQLHLDLYQPAGDRTQLRPLMIWIHGGYFTGGDKRGMSSLATGIAMRGYVSASIEYRLHPTGADIGGAIQEAYADAETAVAWFRRHAADYGIDPNRIAIGGFSAGAFTALNVGYAPDHPNSAASNVAAVVSISGSLSLGKPEPGEPPALFFHSRDDGIVPYTAGQSSCARIQAAGPSCSLLTYEGIGHNWIDSDTLNHTADFLDQALNLPGRK